MVGVGVGKPFHARRVGEIRHDLIEDDIAPAVGTASRKVVRKQLFVDINPHLDECRPSFYLPVPLPGQREAWPSNSEVAPAVIPESFVLDLPGILCDVSEVSKK